MFILRDLVGETRARLFLVERFRDWINYGNRFNNYRAYAGVVRKRAWQVNPLASGSLATYIQDAYTTADQFITSAEQLKRADLDRAERFRSAELHWSALDRMVRLNYDEALLDMYIPQVRDSVRIINLGLKWQSRIGGYALDDGKRKGEFESTLSAGDFDDFHRYAKIFVYGDLYPK